MLGKVSDAMSELNDNEKSKQSEILDRRVSRVLDLGEEDISDRHKELSVGVLSLWFIVIGVVACVLLLAYSGKSGRGAWFNALNESINDEARGAHNKPDLSSKYPRCAGSFDNKRCEAEEIRANEELDLERRVNEQVEKALDSQLDIFLLKLTKQKEITPINPFVLIGQFIANENHKSDYFFDISGNKKWEKLFVPGAAFELYELDFHKFYKFQIRFSGLNGGDVRFIRVGGILGSDGHQLKKLLLRSLDLKPLYCSSDDFYLKSEGQLHPITVYELTMSNKKYIFLYDRYKEGQFFAESVTVWVDHKDIITNGFLTKHPRLRDCT